MRCKKQEFEEEKVEELAYIVEQLLKTLGINMGEGDLKNTPKRVAKSLLELTAGYRMEKPKLKTFRGHRWELIHIGGMQFASLCEHHMLPFIGTVDVWYLSSGKVIGLSKPARLVEWLSRRLMIQERFTEQLFKELWDALQPFALLVRVKAQHLCSRIRGVKSADTYIVTYKCDFQSENIRKRYQAVFDKLLTEG